MKIKRNISFKLRVYGKDNNLFQIRLRTTFNGNRLDIKTGCQINDRAAWDEKAQLVRDGYVGPKNETAQAINNELRNVKDQMDTAFKYFEAMDTVPSVADIQKKFEERMKGTVPQKPIEAPKKEKKAKSKNFWVCFDQFLAEAGEKNAWTPATVEKMEALRVDLKAFKKAIKFEDLTESWFTAFVVYLRDSKQLRTPRKKKGDRASYDEEDIVGLRNSTIEKKLGYFRWFLNWATEKGYNTNKAILEKYKDVPFKENKALPNLTNQAMNRDIKELCKLAGINEEIRITTYKGSTRTDTVYQKWEKLGTHTGRRTFIVNALSLGIPPSVVMKWTGHSDYKAMKPYIDIVDSIKAESMTKFNSLL